MFRATSIALIGAVALCSSAWAGATVQTVKPQVSVNHGQGFKQVAAATGVSTGDQVMAGPGGQAKIVFPDGCVIKVYPGSVVTVGKCYQPMTAGLEEPVVVEEPRIPWVPIVGGLAVLGVGICAVSGCFDDDDGGPRSP